MNEEDPNDSSDEEFSRYFDSALSVKQNGQWLPDHPWNSDNKPDPNLEMKNTVAMSSTYPLSEWTSWKASEKDDVDLAEILSYFPAFVECEMQGSRNGSRKELEQLVNQNFHGESPMRERNLSNLPPHTREIMEENINDHRKDEKYLPRDRHLKATSLKPLPEMVEISIEHMFHFDCEYTLQMYANKNFLPVLTWFHVLQYRHDRLGKMQWIRNIRYKYKEKRWIFIPSFRRAQIALLKWPQDDIVTQESTIRLPVVRPSEFEEYMKHCGHKFPIICLPQDEIGAGYSRYWIQKIALRLKLQFIWMIDDSVECFYEYHPSENPPYHKDEKGKQVCNYRDHRRRKFGLVF